jgi:hypothetical protein
MPGLNPNNQPFYIVPNNEFAMQLIDLTRPYRFVEAARNAATHPSAIYTISYTDAPPSASFPAIVMIAASTFNSLVAGLDPALSAPILIRYENIPVVAADVRLDEFYRVILGLSYFPGQDDPGHEYIDSNGFQFKILTDGQQVAIRVESLIAAGGTVTASHPILMDGNVAAFSTLGVPFTVNSVVDPNLGIVSLNDGVSPISDGTAVELVYDSISYVVVNVADSQRNNIPAVMMSAALLVYLQANQ